MRDREDGERESGKTRERERDIAREATHVQKRLAIIYVRTVLVSDAHKKHANAMLSIMEAVRGSDHTTKTCKRRVGICLFSRICEFTSKVFLSNKSKRQNCDI